MFVIIIAGGLGTRLYPTTLKIPKSMVEIAGYPFIHHQLVLLKKKGVEQIVLCIGHLGSMIEDYVGDGSSYGINIRYSYDGNVLLGTGGAIKQAYNLLPDKFFIQYGDSYLDTNYEAIETEFLKSGLPVLMTVYHNSNRYDASNIHMENGQIIRYDKKDQADEFEYIDYGLVCIKKEVFDRYTGRFDLSTVFVDYIKSGQVCSYEVRERFYEIGSVKGIKETTEYIER